MKIRSHGSRLRVISQDSTFILPFVKLEINIKPICLSLLTYSVRPACEYSVRYLLPAFRSSIARRLVDHYGLTQQEVAKLLGTTQAAVSHYLGDRRAKLVTACEKSRIVNDFAKEAAAKLATNQMTSDDANAFFCELCIKLQDSGVFWAILGIHNGDGYVPRQSHL